MEDFNNIVVPGGSSGTTCGYCSEPGRRSEAPLTSFHSATLEAVRLSCGVGFEPDLLLLSRADISRGQVYQGMIDRGWRRSGD